jgi:hypothetical protein
MVYYSINLLVFGFAVILSYFHHESHSLLSKLKNWEAKTQKRYANLADALAKSKTNLADHRRTAGQVTDGTHRLCFTYQRAYRRAAQANSGTNIPSHFGSSESLTTAMANMLKAQPDGGSEGKSPTTEYEGNFKWWTVPTADSLIKAAISGDGGGKAGNSAG